MECGGQLAGDEVEHGLHRLLEGEVGGVQADHPVGRLEEGADGGVVAVAAHDLVVRGGQVLVGRGPVQLGRPARDGPAGVWGCPLRVAAPGRVLERVAYGPDAVEALLLALQMVRVELLHDLPRATGGRLTWLGQTDLRFPDVYPAGGAPRPAD